MKADLLLRLADYLEKDANNPNGFKFDIWTWASSERDSYGSFLDGQKPEPNCGTSACAMGIAAVSGIFKDEGLTYQINDNGSFEFFLNGSYFAGFSAARRLFGISVFQARYLFDGDHYHVDHEMVGREAELAVAQRIRAFVAGYEVHE